MERGELLAVCLLCWSCSVCVVTAIQRADMFPYGSLSGDFILAEGDDETSRVLSLPKPLYFYDSLFSQLYVSTASLILICMLVVLWNDSLDILQVIFAADGWAPQQSGAHGLWSQMGRVISLFEWGKSLKQGGQVSCDFIWAANIFSLMQHVWLEAFEARFILKKRNLDIFGRQNQLKMNDLILNRCWWWSINRAGYNFEHH